MNIVQIAPYFPPYLGGQERFIFDLSRHLVRKGHSVTVLTSRFPDDSPSRSDQEGIRVFRYRNLARLFRNPISTGLLFPPQSIWRADVIHAHNEHSFASNVAVLLGRRLGKPVVLTVHGRLVMASRFGDFILSVYEKTISRMMFGAAAGMTVATQSDKERLCLMYGIREERISMIPVGIDLDHWDSLRLEQRPAYAWQAGLHMKKVILVATQLIRRKGIDFLLRGMPQILASVPDAILLIAGSGDEAVSLRRMARSLDLADRVRFLGRLFDAELSTAYGAADVFVLPSLSEGLPLCIMEAWAHAKPVVATRIDGMGERFAEVAELVEPSDPVVLAEGVLRVLQDPARAAARGEAGRRLMEREFTWPVVADKMVAAYGKAIQRERQRTG